MKPLAPPPRDAPRHHPPQRTCNPKLTDEVLSRTTSKKSVRTQENLFVETAAPKQREDPPDNTEMRKHRSPITSPRAMELSPRSESSKATTRSKKILVIDPKTKKKYPLNTDDHSLTDKELLVFHRGADNKLSFGKKKQQSSPSVTGSYFTNNDQHSLSGQTLSTASALTDAEHYGGKMYGSCHVQSCALVEETREDELTVRGVEDEREGNNVTPPASATLSPLAALASLASPLNKIPLTSPLSAVQSFFPRATEDIRCKRVGMVIFPHHFGSSGLKKTKYDCGVGLGDGVGDGTLMGIRLKQSPIDFMAHVCFVERGSLAEKMGVEKGDVVTFAISLSNMTSHDPQNTHLAEKLIKRLESVGMRTSYRELFDIFLSKTTNTRPVGIVFRRFKSKPWGGGIVNPVSPKSLSPRSIPNNGESLTITDEFDWSTDFLRSLSVKAREYEFERYIPLEKNQIIEKDAAVLSFLPRPNSSMVSTKHVEKEEAPGPANQLSSLLDFAERYNCAAAHCGFGAAPKKTHMTNGDSVEMDSLFLSNRTLSSLMEQAVGLIFLHRHVDVSYTGGLEGSPSIKNVDYSGSGFTVVRKTEGEWSAPCFLEVLSSKCPSDQGASTSFESVHMIIINKKELAGRLILGNTVKFNASKKQHRVNVLVRDAAFIANNGGRFELMDEFFVAVKVSDEQNQAYYSAMTPKMEISPKDVLVGTLSPPEQSIDFYGALQSLELPYSMHAHPVIPELIQPYCTSDWSDIMPTSSRNKSSNVSTSSTASGGGMRTILKLVATGNSIGDKREIDVFSRRFQYYLMDGVPVQVVLPNNASSKEEKILRLTIRESTSFSEALLELSRKRRPGIMNVGMQGNYVAPFETITKLSRTPPASLELDEEEKRRFFSFETDLSGGPIMMLAKSKKDAMLLLCGLKLLLEREKMHHR